MRQIALSLSLMTVVVSGCSTPAPTCDVRTCAGCCTATGQCDVGNTLASCGSLGGTCNACSSSESCTLGQCTPSTATGGGGGSTDSGADAGTDDAGSDGGTVDGGADAGLSPFVVTDLDPNAVDAVELAIAIDPVAERVGVAYFSNRGAPPDGGTDEYDIKYVEWRAGVVAAVQTVRFVQRKVGIALVFDRATGEPIVSYLGGAAGYEVGQSIFWFQSDAVINRRTGGSIWTETAVATDGNQVTCGNPVSDRGFLVGLWPALAQDSIGRLYLAYRDGHNGQFPMQDWAGSDVELWEGNPSPTLGTCVAEGSARDAPGGHNQLVIGAADQPAITYDQIYMGADGPARNVLFQTRSVSGTWSARTTLLTIPNTQTGPSLGYDSTEGYGIAAVNGTNNQLSYLNSADGTTWSAPDLVFGQGSGGWYPSLAMDRVNHEPAIAHYICSPTIGVVQGVNSCLASEDSLVVSQRIVGAWRQTLVDSNGGAVPKLGFLPSGKRVVVYRTPPALDSGGLVVPGVGALKIAVER